MSFSFAPAPAQSHENLSQHNVQKQYDRVQSEQYTRDMSGSNNTTEVTISQRMISATLGSIFTSLLSKFFFEYERTKLTILATPLDVVRIRLQSQSPTVSNLNLSKFNAYTTSFKQLPPDLGVTACCREVFWIGNNGQVCLAGSGNSTTSTVTDCAVEETQRKTFNSTFDGLKKIARNEGITTLWRGLSPTLLMAIPANVIYFTGYDWLRYNNASPIKKYSKEYYIPLIAGSVARVAAAIAVSPIEMFRTRMQATSGSTTGIFKQTLSGLHRMTQTQGYTSLWRGLTLTMWRDVPFSGFYWWGYEALRKSMSEARQITYDKLHQNQSSNDDRIRPAENHTTTFIDSFSAGAISGAIAAFVTTPFDVGKTRQQVYRHTGDDLLTSARSKATAGKTIPEELSMPRFLYHIFKEEGFGGLIKGWAARCLKVAPACAIMISSYEVGKLYAKTINERKEDDKVKV